MKADYTPFEATLLMKGWEHLSFMVNFNTLDDVSTIASSISRQISSKLKEYEEEGYLIDRTEMKKKGGMHHLLEVPCLITDPYKRQVFFRIIARKQTEAERFTAQMDYFIANLDERPYQDPVKLIHLLTKELDRILNQ